MLDKIKVAHAVLNHFEHEYEEFIPARDWNAARDLDCAFRRSLVSMGQD
jgi:hypothetical protein